MPDTLRDRLAAILGPGNDDETAYAQADACIEILNQWDAEHSKTGDTAWDAATLRIRDKFTFALSNDEMRYVLRLMWQLPKWDEQEAAFAERLEQAS